MSATRLATAVAGRTPACRSRLNDTISPPIRATGNSPLIDSRIHTSLSIVANDGRRGPRISIRQSHAYSTWSRTMLLPSVGPVTATPGGSTR
ncbi:hypothetical protein WT27_09475 [Burkholderia territorii]|uniref:Uncharacterized protein n=1 Tax=Burkholderia territorii TaxID=1503055 RepID=A0A105V9Q1_9BURK|nr:hypothetical protein WT27_09475 [Burkholderia territorii]